jgi:hypothetical protein
MARSTQLTALALLVGAIAAAGAVAASDGSSAVWSRLGERVVADTLDHDSFDLGSFEDPLTTIKFRVEKRSVHFLKVKVHFANGGVQDADLDEVVHTGKDSTSIDLTGDDRVIKSVEVWFEPQTRKRPQVATVVLFGRP